eukprot:scaffold527_cov368-Prasinococcus_capsulatus_cf.AAC.57
MFNCLNVVLDPAYFSNPVVGALLKRRTASIASISSPFVWLRSIPEFPASHRTWRLLMSVTALEQLPGLYEHGQMTRVLEFRAYQLMHKIQILA